MATPYDEEPVLSWGSNDSPRPSIDPAPEGREIAEGLTPDLSGAHRGSGSRKEAQKAQKAGA